MRLRAGLRPVPLAAWTLAAACAVLPGADGPAASWDAWRGAVLAGTPTGEMPPIPAVGWRLAAPGNWFRPDAEVSDHDGDGRVDSLRIEDPPRSGRHHIWVDLDRDGFFDVPRIHPAIERPDPRWRVPEFAPVNPPPIGSSPAPSS